jgi:hypothetical protein
MLVDLEKAARLMVSRHLNAVWKELFQLWYTTPFIPMCISALFAFVLFGNISNPNRGDFRDFYTGYACQRIVPRYSQRGFGAASVIERKR